MRISRILILLFFALPAMAGPLRLVAVDLRHEGEPLPAFREAWTVEDPKTLQALSDEWLRAMDGEGYPFAQVWYEERGVSGDTLLLACTLIEGPRASLGEVDLPGRKRLGKDFLREVMSLDSAIPFSLHQAEEARERLLASGWFQRIEDPVLAWDAGEGKIGLQLSLEEIPRANRATALFGGSEKQKVGRLDLALFSPFGRARSWQLQSDWQGQGRSRSLLNLEEPRLFHRALDLALKLKRSVQDSTWMQQGAELELSWRFSTHCSALLSLMSERELYLLEDQEIDRRGQGLGIRCFYPGERPLAERRLKLHWRWIERSGSEEESQWDLRGEGLWGQALSPRFGLRLRGGLQWLESKTPASEAELFSLGGAKSLRGWDEEHFRGEKIALGSLEAVYGDGLELSFFLDYAWGRSRIEDFEGWGYGLSLRAPAERAALSLALALGEGHEVSDIRVHLLLETGF
ncbi:MAG: hypothetical protein QF492_05235 [Candidatus Krumholzibacteria bacterium]|nr:hypothetical protein [Candidatus Krumholzibacteria bacterium]MDP6669292.1 hypothetical protein [Candidatus Krumholzibacteria bacterium]MDP6796685.1 hypothetical protein [Candidatus Krumholzibacteria bacterium]MDP7020742.1 hypothetical protein [Candidatus Krumholzibacteria bacterium]